MATNFTPDQISKLPPELQRAAELCEKLPAEIWQIWQPSPSMIECDDGTPVACMTLRANYQPHEYQEVLREMEQKAAFIAESRTALPLALTYCLQMQEERDARDAQLSRIAETVAKLPSITGLQEGCVKDHSLIWMAIRDAQDAYRDTLARHQREAQQHAKRAETAEATIATLTREKSELIAEIFRLNCTTGAALSHTPEGKI